MPDMFEGLEAHLDAAIPAAPPEAPPPAPAPVGDPKPAPEEKPEPPKPAAEAAPTDPPPPKPSEYAQKFLKLTREERAARERQQKLDQRETEIKTAEPELATAKEVLEALKDPKKALALMSKHGLTLRQLNDARVAELESGGDPAPETTPNDGLVKKLARVEEELESLKTERQREREDVVLSKFDSEVRQAIQSPDFELVQSEGEEGVELVKEIVKQHLAATKELLEYKEAARLAEEHLERKAEKIAKTKKFQSRHAPAPESPPSREPEEPKTLSGDSVNRGAGGSEKKNESEETFEQFLARKFG